MENRYRAFVASPFGVLALILLSSCSTLPEPDTSSETVSSVLAQMPRLSDQLDWGTPNSTAAADCIGSLVRFSSEKQKWEIMPNRFLKPETKLKTSKVPSVTTEVHLAQNEAKRMKLLGQSFEANAVYNVHYTYRTLYAASTTADRINDGAARRVLPATAKSGVKYALVLAAGLIEETHSRSKGTNDLASVSGPGWVADGFFFREAETKTKEQIIVVTLIRLN
jgi:hypothetical protein